jgi:hypothetical protein
MKRKKNIKNKIQKNNRSTTKEKRNGKKEIVQRKEKNKTPQIK